MNIDASPTSGRASRDEIRSQLRREERLLWEHEDARITAALESVSGRASQTVAVGAAVVAIVISPSVLGDLGWLGRLTLIGKMAAISGFIAEVSLVVIALILVLSLMYPEAPQVLQKSDQGFARDAFDQIAGAEGGNRIDKWAVDEFMAMMACARLDNNLGRLEAELTRLRKAVECLVAAVLIGGVMMGTAVMLKMPQVQKKPLPSATPVPHSNVIIRKEGVNHDLLPAKQEKIHR